MAHRLVAIAPSRLAGSAALALVLALTLGSLAAVAATGGLGRLGAADWAAARFTLWQAFLSTVLSLALAVPVARALARRAFPGRRAFVAALGAPFLLPVIVAVMALLSVFGRNGLVSSGLAFLGLGPASIYGLSGILLAHVFLNLPLAVRMLLHGWEAIPAERFRLAASLDAMPGATWRLVERPMLAANLPGAGLAIFLICLSSFTVVLVLGGGPRATTLELALYQAFRMEFDLAHAGALGLLQAALALAAAALGLRLVPAVQPGHGRYGAVLRRPGDRTGARLADAAWLAAAAAFLALPLAAVVARGLPAVAGLPAPVWAAAARSVGVAVSATVIVLGLALPLVLMLSALPAARRRHADALAMLALAVSPLVIGTGLFLVVRPWVSPGAAALALTTLVNAVMALPFVLRILMPHVAALRADYDRLSLSLGLRGFDWARLVMVPRLRRPLAFAAGLSAALAAGDLGVVALFADPARSTLPMQVQALAGSYRTDDAAGAAVLLAGLALSMFLAFDKLGGRDAEA